MQDKRNSAETQLPVPVPTTNHVNAEESDGTYAVVTATEARAIPYPYVHVNDDGTVRELHAKEREHLEMRFHPGDGGRPYVKGTYGQRDGWGDLSGYCARSAIPPSIEIQDAPEEDPSREEALAEWYEKHGLEVIDNGNGTRTIRKRPDPSPQ